MCYLHALHVRHNYSQRSASRSSEIAVPAKSDSKHPKVQALLEEGTLNPAPGKVQDPKFHDGEFFDPRDIVQVKYEMLRRVSVEKASVTGATEEYGVSRPTYYQTKSSFEEAGIAGLVPRKRGPHGPHKLQGAVLAVYPRATGCGRAYSSAPAGQADPEEIRSRCPSQDDRASGRRKKNRAAEPDGGEGREWLSGIVPQYEALRRAALGHVLPPEARSGLLLFLRRGMWGWARVMATLGASPPPQARREASLSLPAAEESRAVIHIFAAMAMNAEHRGATP